METRRDVEQEWVGREQRIVRYCAGRMSADEESAFETDMLGDVALATDVELAMLLRDALIDPALAPVAQAHRPSGLRAQWLALAAGTVLGAIGISAWQAVGDRSHSIPDVEYLTLGQMRSDTAPTYSLTVAASALLVLEVPAEPAIDSIELLSPDGQRESLKGTRDEGYLRIALSAPVAPGAYTIVSGASEHHFTVAR